MPATIEIDVEDRWDAVALMQRLDPYHAHLVQFAPERWQVHAQAPGRHGEPLRSALDAIEESLATRHLEGTPARIDGRRYRSSSARRRSSVSLKEADLLQIGALPLELAAKEAARFERSSPPPLTLSPTLTGRPAGAQRLSLLANADVSAKTQGTLASIRGTDSRRFLRHRLSRTGTTLR